MELNLDGRQIHSEHDIHDAVEEASGIGWYGRNLDALEECVRWSLDPPIRIRWVNAAASRERLKRFDVIVEILRGAESTRAVADYSFVLEL